MSIQDLGALGEFLGLFLVLATLIYLAIQTRQAKLVAASDAARGLAADFSQIWNTITRDAQFAETIRRSLNDWYSVPATDRLRSHGFLCDLTAHVVATSKANHIRDLAPFVRSYEDNLLGALQTPGGAVWWETCQFFFDPAVVAALNDRLARPDELPPAWTAVPWWRNEA